MPVSLVLNRPVPSPEKRSVRSNSQVPPGAALSNARRTPEASYTHKLAFIGAMTLAIAATKPFQLVREW